MTTIRQGLLIFCTTLLPAVPAAADDADATVAETVVPEAASEPEVPAASWDPMHFALSAELRSVWIRQDDAQRLWGKQRLTSEGLSASYDALRIAGKMTLGLDLAWLSTKVSSDAALSQNVSTQVFDVALSLRYEVLHWLAPYARIAGAVGWVDLSINQPGFELRDRDLVYQGSAGAGLFFRSPGLSLGRTKRSPRLTFVSRLEGGYTVGNTTGFSLKLHADGTSQNPVPVAPVSVGEVTQRFPYLRVSVGVAF